jgi:hypothetical protein
MSFVLLLRHLHKINILQSGKYRLYMVHVWLRSTAFIISAGFHQFYAPMLCFSRSQSITEISEFSQSQTISEISEANSAEVKMAEGGDADDRAAELTRLKTEIFVSIIPEKDPVPAHLVNKLYRYVYIYIYIYSYDRRFIIVLCGHFSILPVSKELESR